jgi:hypothetical protein
MQTGTYTDSNIYKLEHIQTRTFTDSNLYRQEPKPTQPYDSRLCVTDAETGKKSLTSPRATLLEIFHVM